ncbi:hypothetical protein NDU88_004688 [Pleurodeles waltl]|uniref:Uncharacterized protein n=1 Tax=Pleurodeles waltl TaxID=8319 RepID=A0AAV7VL34_PLEWA|nr:hypothetical protein NDU88_004688 [Pleurodeles waltl]
MASSRGGESGEHAGELCTTLMRGTSNRFLPLADKERMEGDEESHSVLAGSWALDNNSLEFTKEELAELEGSQEQEHASMSSELPVSDGTKETRHQREADSHLSLSIFCGAD